MHPKYKINDVIDIRFRRGEPLHANDPGVVAFLKPSDPSFGNEPDMHDNVESFRIIGVLAGSQNTYVLLIDDEILSKEYQLHAARLTQETCDTYNISIRFVDCVFGCVSEQDILGRNSRKSYELYQQLDLEEGATCRECRNHNKYAEPDDEGEHDCTYLCRSCKTERARLIAC